MHWETTSVSATVILSSHNTLTVVSQYRFFNVTKKSIILLSSVKLKGKTILPLIFKFPQFSLPSELSLPSLQGP